MNKQMMTEWRTFLNEENRPAEEISDEVLALIFSKEIDAILKDSNLHEGIADRAKALAKKYGLPLAVATGLLAGTVGGKKFADYQNMKGAEASAAMTAAQPGTYAFHRAARPPGYTELSNRASIEKAWNDIANLQRFRAPVSGNIPTLVDGEIKTLTFSYIPTQEMLPDTVLPMSLMTAERYREMLETRLQRRPQELIYLKNMIFGDTGKWASGTGEEHFRIEGGHALLPPEWSIAHEVYANAVESRLKELLNYIETADAEASLEVFQQLGAQNEEQFREFINDQMYKIGRPQQ